jgi:hypothetical protein
MACKAGESTRALIPPLMRVSVVIIHAKCVNRTLHIDTLWLAKVRLLVRHLDLYVHFALAKNHTTSCHAALTPFGVAPLSFALMGKTDYSASKISSTLLSALTSSGPIAVPAPPTPMSIAAQNVEALIMELTAALLRQRFDPATPLQADAVMEHGVYPVFYSYFPLFLPILLSPLEAFLAFAQSKRPSQRLTMCALLSFFLMPIRCPGIPVVHRLP